VAANLIAISDIIVSINDLYHVTPRQARIMLLLLRHLLARLPLVVLVGTLNSFDVGSLDILLQRVATLYLHTCTSEMSNPTHTCPPLLVHGVCRTYA